MDYHGGCPVEVLGGRPLTFSFWPVVKGMAECPMPTPLLFVTDPWPSMACAIEDRCPKDCKDAAIAFLVQAQDYFRAAAVADIATARPVLLYYSFLNLAKSYILTKGQQESLDTAKHGISESSLPVGGHELVDASLVANPTAKQQPQVFHEFLKAISGKGLQQKLSFPLRNLLPQIVSGHRLWVSAANTCERFVAVDEFEFQCDYRKKETWLQMSVTRRDLSHIQLGPDQLLTHTGLNCKWKKLSDDSTYIFLEQIQGTPYIRSPAEPAMSIVDSIIPHLWQAVTSLPPYRRYYLYVPPLEERTFILPQLLSVYAIMFCLGSITRYRPHQFHKILKGDYGPFIQGFLNDQPSQFLFLMASQFAERDIAKAALV